jgi:hypothetical protein
MDANLTAIAISFVSLLFAGLSLGWNIYRDVILKPKMKVRFQISTIVTAGGPAIPRPSFLNITAVNHGPGRVTCNMIHVRTAPLWRRLLRKIKHGVIIGDWTNPLSGKLPATLEVGQTLNLFLPYDKECFLASEVTHVAITDSFGRSHWAPRRDLDSARKLYHKEFGQTAPGTGPAA